MQMLGIINKVVNQLKSVQWYVAHHEPLLVKITNAL